MDDKKVVPIVADEERQPLVQHVDIPPEVRRGVDALVARLDRIRRALGAPSALPAVKARAKDDLVALSKEALTLWSSV